MDNNRGDTEQRDQGDSDRLRGATHELCHGDDILLQIGCAQVEVSTALPVSSTCLSRSLSSAFSQRAITMVATALPIRLVGVSPCDIRRWMPSTSATLATGMVPVAASVAASTTKAAPAMPAAPFDVTSRMTSSPIWCSISRWVLVACARNTAAVAR